MKVERCNATKFGEEYRSLLVNGELNSSYCLEDINLTLTGGAKYDKISYIGIGIYPCVNSSENNYHCKPREIIDAYMSGAYFSVLAQDIGLNPSNYGNPLIPTFLNVYTTIDKSFFRDLYLYFGITEIQTDEGLFSEKITSKKILQFRKESKSFYFKDNSNFYNGNTMCNVQIRLGEDIRVQKRTYNKFTQVFATTGGYMQLISTVFTIITFITNNLEYQIKLFNSLYNYHPNRRKISLKKELKLVGYLNDKCKNKMGGVTDILPNTNDNMINIIKRKSLAFEKERNISNQNSKNDKMILNTNTSAVIMDSKNIKFNKDNNKFNNSDNKNSNLKENKNNKSNIAFLPFEIDISSSSNLKNKANINKNLKLSKYDYIIKRSYKAIDDYFSKQFQINMFSYWFSKCRKKRENDKLFELGISFYRKKIDVINLFNITLLIEKISTNSEK